MKVQLVTSLREFDALAPVWGAVTKESGQTSPFLSHDWFACCWRTAGPHRRREVWRLEDGAGPVAFVPLVRWKSRVHGFPVRLLGFLESPDTPFVDIPAARKASEVVHALLEALERRSDWDVLWLRKLPVESATLAALTAAMAERFPSREVAREASPYVEISGSWAEFLGHRTQRLRKTCRNIENRLRRAGTVEVQEYRDVDPDGPVFAEVLAVSQQSWKAPQGIAIATMQGMPRFFRELTRRASTNGWLHLWVLRLDGRAVATEYQLGSNGSVHALRADFDEALASLSPGTVLSLRIMESLFEDRGVHEYDLGPGSNEYKLRWATGTRETVSLQVFAPTAYGRLLHFVETRAIPLARRWRARMRRACA